MFTIIIENLSILSMNGQQTAGFNVDGPTLWVKCKDTKPHIYRNMELALRL